MRHDAICIPATFILTVHCRGCRQRHFAPDTELAECCNTGMLVATGMTMDQDYSAVGVVN